MLKLANATVTYPNGFTAVCDIDLTFERGAFTVLLGPSGAGKSTVLRCLNGLVRPTKGDVLDDTGASIFSSAAALRRHRRRTGMVFQQHQLIGRQSALRNVLTGRLAYHGALRTLLPLPRADREIAVAQLDRMGLLDKTLERADRLSGGQQQRVGIARAMAQQPAIVLADEPVASLDPATAEKVLADLHRICREDGITAVVSLHQVALARRFADRIYGLSQGRVVFRGDDRSLNQTALEAVYAAPVPALAAA
jgi:phosphonate transport system ATP-binding protein